MLRLLISTLVHFTLGSSPSDRSHSLASDFVNALRGLLLGLSSLASALLLTEKDEIVDISAGACNWIGQGDVGLSQALLR